MKTQANPVCTPVEISRSGTDSMKWFKYPDGVLPMWVADMDLRCAEPIIAALHERVAHGVFGYSLPSEQLVSTCVEYCQRRWDWRVDPSWLVFSPGLGVAIHTVTRYLGDLQQPVLVPKPIYHVFRNATGRASRQRADIPFVLEDGHWQFDMQTLTDNASRYGPGCVLMLCNPHNPNGKVFTRRELEELAELALRNNWLICADEVHADLILDANCPHIPIASLSPEVAKISITLQSPSKAFNIAGLNFAILVIADPELREQYRHGAAGQVVSQLNPLGMAAAIAAWGGASDQWLEGCIALLRANRELLAAAVSEQPGLTMPHLASTYLAWLDISTLNLEDPAGHFQRHGLGLSPGAQFGDANAMRLNFGCSTQTLTEAIRRLRTACA